MDYYDIHYDDLMEQQDYYECMAGCPDGRTAKECGCGHSEEVPFTTALLMLSPFIVIAIVIIIYGLIKAIRNKRDEKEYEEYQRRLKMGDTKWVKEYEERRTRAFYKGTGRYKETKKKR